MGGTKNPLVGKLESFIYIIQHPSEYMHTEPVTVVNVFALFFSEYEIARN